MNETWWVKPDQLDDEQKHVISLPLSGNHVVIGPPGSGKTNLLLLRANYLVRAGKKDIVILSFTRALQEFIASGGARYAFSIDKVKTCSRWMRDLLWQYGEREEPPDGFEEQRHFFLNKVNELVAVHHIDHVHEAILLDEAQDYLPAEIELFARLGKSLFAVCDSRQKIYAGTDPIIALKSGSTDHELRYHYRNGRRICEFADAIHKEKTDYKPLTPTSQYNEGERPSSVEQPHQHSDVEAQAMAIIAKLVTQRKAYPDELLGVLCPRREELDIVWNVIASSAIADDCVLQSSEGYSSFDDKKICVCSLHSAKGLEFRAVHIAGCDFIKKFPHQRNIVFTGATRAKTALDVYYSESIPGFLEQAFASLQPLPDPPDIGDLFSDVEEEEE